MTSKAGHTATKGPWDYFVGNANGRGLVRVEAAISSEDAGEHICSFPRGSKGEAHAALVAEAGTILHETGLTPRQLAERCKELEAALQLAEEWLVNCLPITELHRPEPLPVIHAALAKATPGKLTDDEIVELTSREAALGPDKAGGA